MRNLVKCRFGLVVLGVLLSTVSSQAAGPLELNPDQPYSAERHSPVTYDVDFSVVITPPYGTQQLRVWLPLPPSDVAQEVSASQLSSFPLEVTPRTTTEPRFGNRFAYFEFSRPQGAQIVRHRFRIRVWELRWKIAPEQVRAVTEWPASFDRYRRGEAQSVVVDERFRETLDQIVLPKSDPWTGLTQIMTWVQKELTYDHQQSSLSASSLHAWEHRRGHCSDYHGLCAAFGRALGYPTRVTYGINAFPKNSPSHCKLEAYLPPYGWVSFDVSETQKLVQAIRADRQLADDEKRRLEAAAQARLASGFRDHTWYLQTRGSDYALEPPASRRVAVVRTAYVEADGQPLPEPDPANKQATSFSWMTVHHYVPDRPVTYPFADYRSLDRPDE